MSFSERYDIGCEECGNIAYVARKYTAIHIAKKHRDSAEGNAFYEDGHSYCDAEIRVWDRMAGPNRPHLVYLIENVYAAALGMGAP